MTPGQLPRLQMEALQLFARGRLVMRSDGNWVPLGTRRGASAESVLSTTVRAMVQRGLVQIQRGVAELTVDGQATLQSSARARGVPLL